MNAALKLGSARRWSARGLRGRCHRTKCSPPLYRLGRETIIDIGNRAAEEDRARSGWLYLFAVANLAGDVRGCDFIKSRAQLL